MNEARKLALTLAKEFYGRTNNEVAPELVVQAAEIFLTFLLAPETGESDPKAEMKGYIRVLRHPCESAEWIERG